MLNRFVIVVSFVNSVLALPHLFAPNMEYFLWQRLALSFSRFFHGILEFLAFVVSTFCQDSSRIAMFLSISIIGFICIWTIERSWHSGDEGQCIVLFALLFNFIFGGVTVWAAALPVGTPRDCTIELDDFTSLRIVEYREKGWSPDVYYFLGLSKNAGVTWNQLSLTGRNTPVVDPCSDVQLLFPDLADLLNN
jgi:hypothetical protein